MSNVRITKNVGLYSGASTFSVPTSPLTSDANTSMLLKFEGANVVDSSNYNAVETLGDAQLSSAQSVF